MIFKPVLVDKILRRQKTMTRRPLKPYVEPASPWIITPTGQRRRRPIPRTIDINGVLYLAPYRVGRPIAVQKGRGREAVAHVEVLHLRTERVDAITHIDARLEGFRTTADFKRYWTTLYAPAGELDDDQLLTAFEAEHAATLVWVITFQLCEAPARYLRPKAGHTSVSSESITAGDDVDGAVAENTDAPTGDAAYLADRTRRPTQQPSRLATSAEREALRSRLRVSYHGWEPEDVAADDSRYGTPGDVRAMRRDMGLRGTDGLDPIPAGELERVLAFMIYRDASLREIALAMDWSLGKTQRELAARGQTVELPRWMQPRDEAA